MEKVKRFGVSIEESLLKKFDSFIKSRKYKNRSEAIRDLIRENFVSDSWEDTDKFVAGAIIMVYDHHKRELLDKLVGVQHDYQDIYFMR
ncbi:MAG: nickel-responsive transcriptional regulator NikR [Actinobacteria bacterium]|nr:nickel-responsive transcriptional regulator NikR [Actinomycetota bacterium]